jgi:phosphomannomutase
MTSAEAEPAAKRAKSDAEALARAWLAAEPDEDIRTELEELVKGDPGTLSQRFTGRLEFGTAGLRAAVGAGPQRMNRLTVRQAAGGLIDYILAEVPDAKEKGVVIGYDMRRKSDLFAWDTARVAAARGVKAMILPEPLPTPVLAWNITRVGAAAGVMVTASHNPPADNGYKVYLGTGSQIVPPQDVGISAAISKLDATTVELSSEKDPLISVLGSDAWDEYLKWVPSVRLQPSVTGVQVAYSAMHGVGGRSIERAFEAAGFPRPIPVSKQHEPDGSFPTVSFPNPEEPGAMDLLIDLAKSSKAQLALANDPDADRLAVAIPLKDGTWRKLPGDEIGWLLADHILRNTSGDDRLVVTTLVSSSLLGKMAEAHGVAFQETFTGFKWMANAALKNPDKRLVFAYEQAIGYLVTGRPLDKDGITAAVVMTELASVLAAEGSSLEGRLGEIADKYGKHITGEVSVKMDPVQGAKTVEKIRKSPPAEIAGKKVISIKEFPEANLLRIWLGEEGGKGVRVQIRPSGTEPKVKIYGEGVGIDPEPYLKAAAELLQMQITALGRTPTLD